MNATHTLRLGSSVNGSASISGSVQEVGTTEIEIPATGIAASTTNQNFTLAFTRANVQFFMFLADQNCTLKTNSTSSPGDTISLLAGIPYYWSRSAYTAQPLAADVTTIYITTTTSTLFQARVITN